MPIARSSNINGEPAALASIIIMVRLRREEYVLKRLASEAESAETDGSRVRALELLGKTVGMFTDRVEVEQDESKSAAELERDLEKRLRDLLGE